MRNFEPNHGFLSTYETISVNYAADYEFGLSRARRRRQVGKAITKVKCAYLHEIYSDAIVSVQIQLTHGPHN